MALQAARGAFALAKLAGGASLAALAMAPAYAQDAAAASPDDDVIVVTGIRASLERAADIKREASQVMDVITAEDVGKLPDANVAEALQRVTGVQITRVFGEGQAVSVRGLQQVRVEVDGRTLLGFSARQYYAWWRSRHAPEPTWQTHYYTDVGPCRGRNRANWTL